MKIKSTPNLRYPITVGDILKKPGDEIKRSTPLFQFTWKGTETHRDDLGVDTVVEKIWPGKFDSNAEGTISKWFIAKGTVIERAGIQLVEVEEPCTHEVQWGSLCANCGKDMTEMDYLTHERDVDRATVNMTHDNTALLVSQDEALKAEDEAKLALVKSNKLSLIVDLDQTVIHTTCEKTIADWKQDPENPNYGALHDVEGFQLADDNVANVAANWYYVKMRPGLKEFLERMSQMYEMHIYTMATRAYAEAVAKIIDPTRKYFSNRILSRDENYTDKLKSLQRLFPNHTDMVVIIDDRADIWQYSPNLVRVPVFNFFPGAGDINASFLPKQQELLPSGTKSAPKAIQAKAEESESTDVHLITGKPSEPASTDSSNGVLTDLEQHVLSMGSGSNPEVLEQQVREQEKVIISQQTERPLLQQQLIQDQEDEKEDESTQDAVNGDTQTTDHHRHRHSILHDDDDGLVYIEENLARIHRAFYDEYYRKKVGPQGRVAELRGEKSPKKRLQSDDLKADVKVIIPRMKNEVLRGTVIVFSGIIPLGMDVLTSDFALWVQSFGATVALDVTRHTTHVIGTPERKTSKLKKAARNPRIHIVTAEWMLHCCTTWKRVDETPYLIDIDPADRGNDPFEDFEDDSIANSGDEGEGTDAADTPEGQLDNLSPEAWQNMDDELEEFMNEDDTEDDGSNDGGSDSESVRSNGSTASNASQQSSLKSKKRKRASASAIGSDAEDSDTSVNGTSKLQKKKKRTLERVSSLTNVVTAEKSSGLPSPETTGPEENPGDDDGKKDDAAADESGDDDLEAEMLAEFEKSENEEEAA